MAVSRSVQFRNAAAVLRAYESREVAPWSIWQGAQFMFKYEGHDLAEGQALLEQHLNVLGQSAAIYTLKVYEDLPKNGKIKSNTPDDGSFNFRFQDEPFTGGGVVPGNAVMNELLTELRTLKQQVAEMQSEDPEPEENPLGIVGHVLNIPGMSEVVAGMLGNLVGVTKPNTPQALAGVPGSGPIKDLNEAIEVLLAKDPLFTEHLIKLATLARDKPEQFTQIVAMMRFI